MCQFCAGTNPESHTQYYSHTHYEGAGHSHSGYAGVNVAQSKAAYGKVNLKQAPVTEPTQAENSRVDAHEVSQSDDYYVPQEVMDLFQDSVSNGVISALAGSKWSSSTISYSFTGPHSSVGIGQHGPVKELSSGDRQTVQAMLGKFEEVIAVNFQQTTGWADIDFRMEQIPGGVGGYASLPSGGRVTFDSLNYNGSQASNPDAIHITPNHWSWFAAFHEVGHSMGLYHPFSSGNASAPKAGTGMTSAELTAGYTVMGYKDGADGNRDQVVGLQLYDIATLQYLYGANMNYNTGNNTYQFDGSYKAYAQWDAGGNDTFYTNVNSNVVFDLRDGDYVNKVGQTEVKIAYGAVIENAIGGGGNDTIRGNDTDNYLYGSDGSDTIFGFEGNDALIAGDSTSDNTDGNDTMFGGDGSDIMFGNVGNDSMYGGDGATDVTDGNDTIYGGAGDDYIVGNAGNDWLIGGPGTDVIHGGLGNDKYLVGWNNGADIIHFGTGDQIRILANVNGTGISNYSDLTSRMESDGNHTWISLANSQGNGGGILVAWHTPSELSASDFLVTSNLFAAT